MKRLIPLTLTALTFTTALQAESLPGYDHFDLTAAHRARPIAASVWYPAANPSYRLKVGDGPIFEPTPAFMAPAVAAGKHPLVLLSHGSGGNADALGWLAAGLVAKGAIVLAVNHHGSTSGDSSPRRSIDLATRAKDLSAALDTALADPAFAPFIDESQISAVGFSLGGSTALGLAGLRFDGDTQSERCSTGPDAADCGFFLRGGADFSKSSGFAADARDPRITRATAIDPGFGGAATAASLEQITIPVHLINLGEATRLPAVDLSENGNNLANRLAGATYSIIAPANHFTFLAVCKSGAAEILASEEDDPICSDPADTDRANIHSRLITDIATALGL
jgi:predicted dienelactone hydrolase